MNSIYVKVMGTPKILIDGKEVRISRKRVCAILYYLLCRNDTVSRNELAELLWPDSDISGKLLSIHLSHLKKALGSDVIQTDGTNVIISPNIMTDVFEEVPSCNKDYINSPLIFLEGFSLPDCPNYEKWISETRKTKEN